MKPIKPSFRHRFNATANLESFRLMDLVDTVLMMTEQATATLFAISIQFDDDKNHCSDAINSAALQAVINQVEDIEAIVKAYWDAQKSPDETPDNKQPGIKRAV